MFKLAGNDIPLKHWSNLNKIKNGPNKITEIQTELN